MCKAEINKQIAKAMGFVPIRVVTLKGNEIIETEAKWKYPDQYMDIVNGMPQLLPDFLGIFDKFHDASKSKRLHIAKDKDSGPIESDFSQ